MIIFADINDGTQQEFPKTFNKKILYSSLIHYPVW